MRKFGLILMLAMITIMAVPAAVLAQSDKAQGGKHSTDPIEVGHVEQQVFYDEGYAHLLYLEDGVKVGGNVNSVDEIDQSTLTSCVVQIHYRGRFGDDGYQDTGWIINNYTCEGFEAGAFNYVMVHESDPRYTGEGIPVGWPGWEYHVLTVSGEGNLARPINPGQSGD